MKPHQVWLEPEAQAFVDATAHRPFLFDLSPKEGRQAVDKVQSGPVEHFSVGVEDCLIPGIQGNQVPVRIMRPPTGKNGVDLVKVGPPKEKMMASFARFVYRPKRAKLGSSPSAKLLPVLVYFHGAGWVFGNAGTHDRLIRELSIGANVAVVFPSYSLSPEAKYPTAIEECFAVVKWVAEHGADHGLDPQRISVGGDSVGGNLAAVITLLAKDRGGPRIVKQLLFYPVTDAAFETESYHQFAEGYFLRRDAMKWFWDQYMGNPDDRTNIMASPLRATTEQLKGLPPALVITAEADVLRDEGEAYANKLREAGVRVTAVRFQGMIHDFVMLNDLSRTAAARGAMALAKAWLKDERADAGSGG